MSDARSSLTIKKSVKDRLGNLDFVRKQTFEEIIENLMNFYDKNKTVYKKWKKK